MMISSRLTPRQQAAAMTGGLALILFLGLVSALAIALAALAVLAKIFLLTLQAIIECLTTVGTLYQSSDPMIKFLLLVVIGYVIYRAGRAAFRKRGNQ